MDGCGGELDCPEDDDPQASKQKLETLCFLVKVGKMAHTIRAVLDIENDINVTPVMIDDWKSQHIIAE